MHEAIRKKWFHGRSWWYANAQLDLLGVAFFRSFQLRAFPLRTLSLGVLIVCGGTLAALPFRRYHTLHDASVEPSQVTGPSQSELQSTQFQPVQQDDGTKLTSLVEGRLDDRLNAYADSYALTSSPLPKQRRQLDIPLTYDDLAVPIDQPQPLMERFNATAPVREQQLEAEKIAELVMPPMEALPLHQQEELSRVAENFRTAPDSHRARAAGRLASRSSGHLAGASNDSNTASQWGSLSTPDETQRQRFWIRQPD